MHKRTLGLGCTDKVNENAIDNDMLEEYFKTYHFDELEKILNDSGEKAYHSIHVK